MCFTESNFEVLFMKKKFSSLIAVLMVLNVIDAHACSCLAVPDEQRYSDASDIFVGKVVETKLISKLEPFADKEGSMENIAAKIKVVKAIKGDSAEEVDVLDGVANGANCAVGLMTGREYLFYLYDNNQLSICDGTKLFNEFSDHKLIEQMLSY